MTTEYEYRQAIRGGWLVCLAIGLGFSAIITAIAVFQALGVSGTTPLIAISVIIHLASVLYIIGAIAIRSSEQLPVRSLLGSIPCQMCVHLVFLLALNAMPYAGILWPGVPQSALVVMIGILAASGGASVVLAVSSLAHVFDRVSVYAAIMKRHSLWFGSSIAMLGIMLSIPAILGISTTQMSAPANGVVLTAGALFFIVLFVFVRDGLRMCVYCMKLLRQSQRSMGEYEV